MYYATIKNATLETSLTDNTEYVDIHFGIMLDEAEVAERHLSFPVGTSEEDIKAELMAYCRMYENDHRLAAEYAEKSEQVAKSEEILANLKGQEIK